MLVASVSSNSSISISITSRGSTTRAGIHVRHYWQGGGGQPSSADASIYGIRHSDQWAPPSASPEVKAFLSVFVIGQIYSRNVKISCKIISPCDLYHCSLCQSPLSENTLLNQKHICALQLLLQISCESTSASAF